MLYNHSTRKNKLDNKTNKTEDDDDAENSDFSKEHKSSINRHKLDDFSHDTLSNSLRRPSSFTIEDDHDSEMASMDDGVSEPDISMNNLQSTSSSNQNNNFARSFINNTARRMSSGIVLSYNFLKGANSKRRDST